MDLSCAESVSNDGSDWVSLHKCTEPVSNT